MKKAIAAILAAAALAGCDSAQAPGSSSQAPVWRLTREGAAVERQGKLLTIDLPGWIWAAEPYCPPDLAIGPNGEAVITSNVIPTLWRVDAKTLAVTVHPVALDADNDKDVGFSRIAYSSEHGAYIAVSETHRSMWRIDAGLTTGQKLARRKPATACING